MSFILGVSTRQIAYILVCLIFHAHARRAHRGKLSQITVHDNVADAVDENASIQSGGQLNSWSLAEMRQTTNMGRILHPMKALAMCFLASNPAIGFQLPAVASNKFQPQGMRDARQISMKAFDNPLPDLAHAVLDAVDAYVDANEFAVDSIFGRRDFLKTVAGIPAYLQLYRNNVDKKGVSLWAAQNWQDQTEQQTRFAVFAREIDFKGQTILDVGCGLGDFAKWLDSQGKVPSLLRGVDAIPEFVQKAKQTAPSWAEYASGDVVADPSVLGYEWDYVVISGTLATLDPAQAERLLGNCWKVARRGMAFNFLSPGKDFGFQNVGKRGTPYNDGSLSGSGWVWRLRSSEMVEWSQRQAGAKVVKLLDNYLDGESTIVMHREDASEDTMSKLKKATEV